MKKKRNILWVLISCFGALAVFATVLFAVAVFELWLFLSLLGVSLVGIGVCAFLLCRVLKKMELAKIATVKANVSSGNYMLDVYNLLGVAPQYNKDGTLKNIYEILQIKPVYDEQGNRVYTAYELLGIVPLIGADGKEIPQVFAIKNRVGRIAKVSLSTEFLTRKLTPEEEEQKLIRETLEKKLDEANKEGDSKKAAAIKKAIKAQDKKPAAKKKPEKEVTYKTAKGKLFKPVTISDPNKDKNGKNKGGGKKDDKKSAPASAPTRQQPASAPTQQPAPEQPKEPPKTEPVITKVQITNGQGKVAKKKGTIFIKAWEGKRETENQDESEEQLEQ